MGSTRSCRPCWTRSPPCARTRPSPARPSAMWAAARRRATSRRGWGRRRGGGVETEETEGKPSSSVSQMTFKRGDVEKGFAEADAVIEGGWRSAMVHQSYIEPHSTIADYDASGELSIWTSTQGPFFVRDEVSKALGIPESRIRVTATEGGGGFGGKIYLTELMVGVLAMAVRRPVKYIMSRGEDMLAATPAPLAIVELKTGMKKDGTLTALQSRLIYDSGAFPGAPMLPGCLLVGGY